MTQEEIVAEINKFLKRVDTNLLITEDDSVMALTDSEIEYDFTEDRYKTYVKYTLSKK